MSQWKNDDSAANSVLWGVTQYNVTPNTANRNAFYDNVSRGAYKNNNVALNIIAGQFGVSAGEIANNKGPIVDTTVTYAGTGYAANAAVTFTAVNGGSGAAATATANSTGKISAIAFTNNGNNYVYHPTTTIAAPAANSFNANTAVIGGPANSGTSADGNSVIYVANAFISAFVTGDIINYTVATGNTAVANLTTGTAYYVQSVNSTAGWIALAAAPGGSRIILGKGLTETGHSLQGATATAVSAIGGAKNEGVTHAGWNIRTVGVGGRAGRVQYETLVAMGSLSGDANNSFENTILPGA